MLGCTLPRRSLVKSSVIQGLLSLRPTLSETQELGCIAQQTGIDIDIHTMPTYALLPCVNINSIIRLLNKKRHYHLAACSLDTDRYYRPIFDLLNFGRYTFFYKNQ